MNYDGAREIAGPLYRSLMPVSFNVQAVGELRRRSEVVNTIEFLILPKVPADDVREVVRRWGGVLVQSPDNAIRVRLDSSCTVTVWLCKNADVFGGELFIRTGPEAFTKVVLERLAKNKVSFDLDTFRAYRGSEDIPATDEAHVFHMAGLGLVAPPELREDFDVLES